MTTATIFGKGNMGTAIASILAAGGAAIEHVDTSSVDANIKGDIVILAVPYTAVDAIVRAYGSQFAGKIVVDISNPVDFETFQLAVPADSSAAAELAGKVPDATVLKAFNTNFAASLTIKSVGSNPTTVLVAGDDVEAKQALTSAITAAAVDVIDAGELTAARELEAIGFLQLQLAVGQKIGFAGGFTLTR
ncbi:dinucleotide-binding protein (plasmid) [Rhodococcus qingshengii]|uniref:NADPH-dependent F420 reductase n=1 Tax=Rhodococcus qingshengii TaxID=334542 RepID=UPI0007E53834|nr:NAD(P)-binding domain-containing protein [Rhodococcus qingshengii]BCF86386.1 dinucleotide-binding protein [Rhodococcus qingshengii]